LINRIRKVTPCAWPYCTNEGKHQAPSDPRNLRKRILLCDEHIVPYNKSWNGLEGFNADEIFDMQHNPAWDKPTWKLGEKQDMGESVFSFSHGSDKNIHGHDFFSEETQDGTTGRFSQNIAMPPQVVEAMDIIGVEEPLELIKLKKAYKNKVKENHPDRTTNKSQAEEKLKEINLAYQKLNKYLKLKKQ
jgi:hypothetical protein